MSSPFKLLDAYTAADQAIFFGRESEIEQIYSQIHRGDLLLVYGLSGTGKSSLVQCGLARRFKPTDRFEVVIRREEDLNASLMRELQRVAVSGGGTAIEPGASPGDAVYSIYLDRLRPVHLVFDQFEELLLLGTAAEQQQFFTALALLQQRQLRCKVILILREEFIGRLDPFERLVPGLLENRVRVEPMTRRHLEDVVVGTTEAAGVTLADGRATAQHILDNLGSGVQLAYVQVYLDKLYRRSADSREPSVFSTSLVTETGALGDVLADFLDEQKTAVQAVLAATGPVPPDAVSRVLESCVTVDGTKQPVTANELAERLPDLAALVPPCLQALERRRVIRLANGVYELAHDSLARRVADARSAERKMQMKAERMIRERLGDADAIPDRLLIEAELDFIKPFEASLELTEAERTYYARSVKARRDAQRARMRRLIATAAVIVVALSAGLAYVAYQNDRLVAEQQRVARAQAGEAEQRTNAETQKGVADQQQSRADKAIADAKAAIGDLYRIEGSLQPVAEAADARRQLRERAHWLIDRLNLGALDATNSPTSQFWSLMTDGDLERRAARVTSARKNYRQAQALAAAQASGGDQVWKRNEALSLVAQGELASENMYSPEWDRPVRDIGFEAYNQAFEIVADLVQQAPDDLALKHDFFNIQIGFGKICLEIEDRVLAASYFNRALALADDLANRDREDWRPDLKANLTRAHDQLIARKLVAQAMAPPRPPMGTVIDAAVANDIRQRLYSALRLATRLQQITPTDTSNAFELWQVFMSIGDLERDAGRPADAHVAYLKALQQNEFLANASQRNFAVIYDNIGQVLMPQATEGARDQFEAERQIVERRVQLWPNDVDSLQMMHVVTFNLGAAEEKLGHVDVAKTWFLKAREYAIKTRDGGMGTRDLERVTAVLTRLGVVPPAPVSGPASR